MTVKSSLTAIANLFRTGTKVPNTFSLKDMKMLLGQYNFVPRSDVNILNGTDPTSIPDSHKGKPITSYDFAWGSGAGIGKVIVIDLDDDKFTAKHGFGFRKSGYSDLNQRPVYWNGGTYTFSIWTRLTPGLGDKEVQVYVRGYSNEYKSATRLDGTVFRKDVILDSTDWTKIEVTVDSSKFINDNGKPLTDCSVAFGVQSDYVNGVDFAEPMLAYGDKVQDYKPSLFDMGG